MFLMGLVVSAWVIGMGGEHSDRFAPLWISLTLFIVPLLLGITALIGAWYQASPKGALPSLSHYLVALSLRSVMVAA